MRRFPLLAALAAFGVAPVLVACDDEPIPSPPPPVTAPTATTSPTSTTPTGPTARTLVTARAMGTRADNLVVDPTFGSANAMYAAAIYAANASLSVEALPTSPAGLSQNVLRVTPEAEQPALVLTVQGGADAMDASIWVAAAKSAKPSVYLSSADGRDSFELEAVKDQDQVHGDRTYVRYAARVTTPIYGKLYLVVETGGGKQPAMIAAPDIAPVTKISGRKTAPKVALSPNAARAVRAFATRPVVPGPTRPEPPSTSLFAGRISTPRL